jgi:hypothetical protein
MLSALTTFMAVLATATTVTLGQPPSEGYEIGNFNPFEIIMPLTVAQCEPVLFYYNVTPVGGSGPPVLDLYLVVAEPGVDPVVSFIFPNDVGYLEWICNIPAGQIFVTFANSNVNATYVVQPGSSSACLGPITTTYSDLSYYTSAFASFTAISYSSVFATSAP